MNIFITGGTSGIGLAVATLYLETGHRVGICGRDLGKIPSNLQEKFPLLECFEADVTDRERLLEVIREFSTSGLDLVLASAGRSVGSKSKTPNFEVSRKVIEVNVLGVLNTFEAALEYMIPRKSGHIAAIASVAGMVGLPGASSYSASKSAVIKLCESYSLDFKNIGIDVTCICPGFVSTPLTDKNDHAMPFLMAAEDAALEIKRALEKKKHLYVFPFRMKVLMYFLDRIPRGLYRLIMSANFANYSNKG